VSGDGQALVFPEGFDVRRVGLVDVDFAVGKSLGSYVVGRIDVVDDVLGNGQLAPHGLVLAPVVVIPLNHPFLVVLLLGGVGTGMGSVPHGLVLHGSGIAAVGLSQFVQVGLLHDVHLGQILQHFHPVQVVGV